MKNCVCGGKPKIKHTLNKYYIECSICREKTDEHTALVDTNIEWDSTTRLMSMHLVTRG
jgi:hypothetical protein